MTRKQKNSLFILSFITCALSVALGDYAYQSYRAFMTQPLGPQIPYTPLVLPPTWTAAPNSQAGMVTLAPTIVIPPTHTPEPVCVGPSFIMNVLAVGADSRLDAYQYGLGDAIRLARIDFNTPKITILEFPRDLWVEIPYISDNLKGIDHGKLNQAYLFGQPGDGFHYWDDPSGGSGLLALTLDINFGAKAEHYVTVNMRTFEKIVNALDGIDIYVPDENASQKTGLPIGANHLDGAEALKVARNREEGVFERANNQNRVLCALRKKFLNPETAQKIPALIESFRDNILTDFTPEQIGQLACLGAKMPLENIVFASFPQELFTPSRQIPDLLTHNPKGTFIWKVDFKILRDYVARFQDGTWPEPKKLGAPKKQAEIVCQ
jgi:LCP family protein required for cell wall assembly